MNARIGAKVKAKPTVIQAAAYQKAWDYFNRTLWNGSLSPCMLVFSRRKAKNGGHFSPHSWQGPTGKTHEIALNADILNRWPSIRDVFALLVHEMCHQWQFDHGEKYANAYHNAEWGQEMDRVGLTPTATGEPGGKRTGYRMFHYIVEGGPYDLAFKAMPPEISLPWTSGMGVKEAEKPKPKNKDKVKYSCSCGTVWGKSGIKTLWCMGCHGKMTGEGSGKRVTDWLWEKQAEALVRAFAAMADLEVLCCPDMFDGCGFYVDESHGKAHIRFNTYLEALVNIIKWMPKEASNGFDFSGVEIPVEVSESNGVLSYEQEKLEHKGEGQ